VAIRLYRPPTWEKCIDGLEACRYAYPTVSDEEQLFYIINKFHPSKLELARARFPQQLDQRGPPKSSKAAISWVPLPNHFSRNSLTVAINDFNGHEKYRMEIVSNPVKVKTLNGYGIGWALMIASGGDETKLAIKRSESQDQGVLRKIARLRDAIKRPGEIKKEISSWERSINARIKRGSTRRP